MTNFFYWCLRWVIIYYIYTSFSIKICSSLIRILKIKFDKWQYVPSISIFSINKENKNAFCESNIKDIILEVVHSIFLLRFYSIHLLLTQVCINFSETWKLTFSTQNLYFFILDQIFYFLSMLLNVILLFHIPNYVTLVISHKLKI
jgi:hypothetical protein